MSKNTLFLLRFQLTSQDPEFGMFYFHCNGRHFYPFISSMIYKWQNRLRPWYALVSLQCNVEIRIVMYT